MRQSFFLGIVLFVFIVVFYGILPSGCANIIPPSGGPRDSIAPQLISAEPKDSALNFKGKRITFTFDEYIDDPQDLTANLLFTPTFEVNPEITVRGKTMSLRFIDSLLPNTTYTLNFGNAIKDINEGNVLHNFVYTFSTGPVLDSLTLSGKVVLAETGKVDTTLLVLLHRNLTDSAVRNERPVYIAKLDAQGTFRFQNLPKGTFDVYALGDPSPLHRYLDSTKLFAFADSAITTGSSNNVTLYAYRYPAVPQSTTTTARNNGSATDRRLRFTTVPTGGPLDLQNDYIINFQTPLKKFDSSLLSLTVDTTFSKTAYTVLLDSSKTLLRIRSSWKEGAIYNLILNKEFAEDSAGRKLLKTDTVSFSIKKLKDYAQLRIKVRNIDLSKNPVLQFVQNDAVVFSASIKSGTFTNNLFNPGEYDLRILYDTNGNGKWDPGHFFGIKRQPELVKTIERKIPVKAGLENEFDVSL